MRKLIIIGTIFLTLFSYQYLNQLNSDNSLTEKIESESEIIDFNNLNEFDWDNLLILGPYSVIDNIEKELNLDL